jgi:hypothetical protein
LRNDKNETERSTIRDGAEVVETEEAVETIPTDDKVFVTIPSQSRGTLRNTLRKGVQKALSQA